MQDDNKTIFFYKDQTENSEMDIRGVAWVNTNIAKKSGLKIKFTPNILVDNSYYGFQKYPQGVAFILTSNPTKNMIGEKRSGIGFDGIYNSIAFFFDFITNPDKQDMNNPHFSITYNLNGAISSACRDVNLCNLDIPNFYDREKDEFLSNMKVSIELYGGKVKIYFDDLIKPIFTIPFTQFGEIMDREEVYFGISSSMTQNKGVKIHNLQLMNIVTSDLPSFEIKNKELFLAGSILTLQIFKKSSCNENLDIFKSEQNLLSLKMNDDVITEPYEIRFNFDPSVYGLEINLRKVFKDGVTIFTGYWNKKPIQTNILTVFPGNEIKFDVCNTKYDKHTNILERIGTTNDIYYTFDICVTDLYRNQKSFDLTNLDDLIKVEYPYNIISEFKINYTSNREKSIYTVSIPTISKGIYKIYNSYFFNENIKSFKVVSGKPDNNKSYGEIKDYLENKITEIGKNIRLLLFIMDALGNSISNEEFKKLKCSLQKSVVIHNFKNEKKENTLDEYDIIDGIPELNFSPKMEGEYIFKPKIQCEGELEAYEINCNNCIFFVATHVLNNSKFEIFSDFYEKYYLSNELNQTNNLVISLDEERNFKLTSILILDNSGIPISINDMDKKFIDAFNSFNVKFIADSQPQNIIDINFKINPVGGIDIFMKNKTDRTKVFSALEKYSLIFSLNNDNFRINEINIPVKFSYKDDFLNNVSNSDLPEAPENFYAIYGAGTYELRASSNQLLFKVIAKNTLNQITFGRTLDCSKISLVANYYNNRFLIVNQRNRSEIINIFPNCQKNDIFLSVSGSFTKSGFYDLKLSYDRREIFEIEKLKIIPRQDITELKFDSKCPLIKSQDEKTNTIILHDQKVGELFSFDLTMFDEFGNIMNEKFTRLINKIKIKQTPLNNKNKAKVTQLFDGRILVISEENEVGEYVVSLTLMNNITYTLKWERISEELDPYYSGSDMIMETNTENGEIVSYFLEVLFYPFDKFNKNFKKHVLENEKFVNQMKNSISLYAVSSTKKIVEFNYINSKIDENLNYFSFVSKENITEVGEYELHTYYNNIPMICQVCFARLDQNIFTEKYKGDINIQLFYIKYTYNYKLSTDDKYLTISDFANIPLFANFKDIHGNDILEYSRKLQLGLYSEKDDKKVGQFCNKNVENKNRQYIDICKDFLNDVKKLPDGNYYIADNLENNINIIKYKLTIQRELDQTPSIPSLKYSFLVPNEENIIGAIDNPARIIIDFRNNKNQRYENIDIKKITLKTSFNNIIYDQNNENLKVFYGPENGLITILFYHDKIIKETENQSIDILFDNNPIVSKKKIIIRSGRIAKIEILEDKMNYLTSNKRINFLKILDNKNNPVQNFDFNEDYILGNLITIKNVQDNSTFFADLFYNYLTGTISFSLDKIFFNELEIISPFISSPIKIPRLSLEMDINNSFAYLDNINNGKIGEETIIKIQLIDDEMNYIQTTKEYIENKANKFTVMVLRNYNEDIEFIETINYNKESSNEKNIIILSKKLDLSGDYFFIPFYNNIPIKCTFCKKTISIGNNYNLNLTSLKVKSGDSWIEKSIKGHYNLYKINLPVFKILLKDSSGTIITTPIYDLSVDLINEKGNVIIPLQLHSKNSNGLYAYLNEIGRNKFFNLEISDKLILKINNNNNIENSIIFENFLLMNSDIHQNKNVNCPNETLIRFFEEKNHIVVAGKEAFIEFDLVGCENDEKSINEKWEDFHIKICNDSNDCSLVNNKQNWYFNIIPSDSFGKYILFIGSTSLAEKYKINIKYKNFPQSNNINIDVISDNFIKSIAIVENDIEIKNGFVFLKLNIFDTNNNLIKRDFTNIYLRDIFLDIVDNEKRKIVYELTYKDSNYYYIKLLRSDLSNCTINIPNSQTSIFVKVKQESNSLINSIFTFDKFIFEENSLNTNKIAMKIKYRDDSFNSIKDFQKRIENLEFKYNSYDFITKAHSSISSNEIKYITEDYIEIIFETNLKIFRFSNIRPYGYDLNELSCFNCLITDDLNNYIYSVNHINECKIIPLDEFYLIRQKNDKLFLWYEGYENKFSLIDSYNSKEINIFTASRSIGNGLIQTFIGYNNSDNILNDTNYNLIISNVSLKKKTFKIINVIEEVASSNKIDLNNVIITPSHKSTRLYAGEMNYFFIEARDKNYNLTKFPISVSIRNDIKQNIINTAIEGIYLIEYSIERIPGKEFFKVYLDNQELKYIVDFNVLPNYPQKMDSISIHSPEIIEKKMVKYQVGALDKFGNVVCDGRLGFEVINEQNMNDYYFIYDKKKNICYAEFLFYGKSVLFSPLLGNIKLNLENNKELNISNFNSFIHLNSNNINKEENLKLELIIFDEFGFILPDNYQINMRLMLFYIFNNNQRIFVKEYNSASINSKLDNKDLIKLGNYLLKIIINETELSRYAYFRLEKKMYKEITDVEIMIKDNKNWFKVKNIYNEMNKLDEIQNKLKYPYTFNMNLINPEGEKIALPQDISVEASFIPDQKLNLAVNKIFNLDGIVNSQTSYLLTQQKSSANVFFHLPKGKYYVKLIIGSSTMDKMIKYIPIEIEKGLYQNKDFEYHLPTTSLDKSFDIVAMDGINTIYSNLGSYTTANICLRFNNRIYNQYLDSSLFSVNDLNNNNCNYYLGVFFRGCTQFSIKCSDLSNGIDNIKTQISYNGVISSNNLNILIDPSMPPSKFVVRTNFPKSTKQMNPIQAIFNVYDKDNKQYKYLNTENFEIYDNNKKLEKKSWKFISNDGSQLQFELKYPPKSHSIKVLFRIGNNSFMNIPELNSKILVNQGEINPLETILGIPIYYKSGEVLEIPIMFKDNYNNCFDDEVDLSLIKLKILSKENLSFDKFEFKKSVYETEVCSNYVLAYSNNFIFKDIGIYNVEFSYNNQIYRLPNNNLKIFSNIISQKTSTITVRNKEVIDSVYVKAGEEFEILIKGTDINENPIQLGEVIEKLTAKISNLTPVKENYVINYYTETDYMVIALTIFKPDVYNLDIFIDNYIFNSEKGLRKINVMKGNCDIKYPNIKVEKEKYFVGEYAKLNIICRDSFNNTIGAIDKNKFSIRIYGTNLNSIESDILPYSLESRLDMLTASFLVLYTGNYEIAAYLDGAQYGSILNIKVIKQECPKETPLMCSDRKCVTKAYECQDLVNPYCTDPEKPFYCFIDEVKTCVSNLEDCKCKSNESLCKGMCIPDKLKNFCLDKPNIDCTHIPGTKPCFDGTCKLSENCGNDLGCPLGYKICGSNCIKKDSVCDFSMKQIEKCNKDQILCWDYSCATKYENCPTRKICDNEKDKVCPDGTCISNSEFCPQPPVCVEPFDYLCPNFTCRKSEKDCAKKTTCPLGFSLCQNDQCHLDCKQQEKYCEKENKYMCKSGECVDYPQLCPTEIACFNNQIKCSNGACVKSIEECKFYQGENRIHCSFKTPILCQDLSCVDDIKKCENSYINKIKCPTNSPYRCQNNECRRDIRGCPTTTTCPDKYPMLCSDGSCQKAFYHCKDVEYEFNKKSDFILCSDGRFVSSYGLCPTQITCNKDMIKCWNGACVFKIDECPIPKIIDCPKELPFRCIDGSCRISGEDCSSISICPFNRPIKCLDGSCREHLELCPQVKPCPSNYTTCANGTCAPMDKCSSEPTCPYSHPLLCDNKKCVSDLRDCEINKAINYFKTMLNKNIIIQNNMYKKINSNCENGFTCPDGECVPNRLDCIYTSPCDVKNPVRCHDISCANSRKDCNSVKECPVGYIKCINGECKPNEDLCLEETCPIHMPYRCSNGDCAENQNLCDNKNGCPHAFPIKCKNGACKFNKEECRKIEKEIEQIIKNETDYLEKIFNEDMILSKKRYEELKNIDEKIFNDSIKDLKEEEIRKLKEYYENKKNEREILEQLEFDDRIAKFEYDKKSIKNQYFPFCDENSKNIDSDECLLKNGCPKNLKIRCSEGICVNDAKNCQPSKCKFPQPIKCYNGLCVESSTECNLISSLEEDYQACKSIGLENHFMCADGTCVKTPEHCKPLYDCPGSLTKCNDGICRYPELCPNINESCPKSRPNKCMDGRCVEDEKRCTKNYCFYHNNNYKCNNGLCVKDMKFCENIIVKPQIDNSCILSDYSDLNKSKIGFRCNDGRCVEAESYCYTMHPACNKENPILCENGVCKESYEKCKEETKVLLCNENTHIRCLDKKCVLKENYYLECKNKNGCPLTKPIKCSSGECVSNNNNCQIYHKCPFNKPFICADLRCVEDIISCNPFIPCKDETCKVNGLCAHSELDCKNHFNNLCPLLSPVKCPNGFCSTNINECEKSFYSEDCKEGEFFCTFKGECMKTKSECIGEEFSNGINLSTTRLLQISTGENIENNCNIENPYSCFDGTCRKRREDCNLPNACLNSEFKCFDGTCVKDQNSCGTPVFKNSISINLGNQNKTYLDSLCNTGYFKCNDGLCRIRCPAYNGCDLNNPYQCSNGRCVKSKLECLGYSMCLENQYRCINGECKKDPNECDDIKRLYSPVIQQITFSKYDSFYRELVFDKNNRVIVSLFIPANSVNIINNLKYTAIEIKPVPHSILRDLEYNYNQTDSFMYRIANTIKDSDGELNFENSVLSPVLNITCSGCLKDFNNLGLIKVEHNFYIDTHLDFKNYCLAKLIDKKWRCYDTLGNTNDLNNNSGCISGRLEEHISCGSRKTYLEQDTFAIDSFGVYALVIIPQNKRDYREKKENIFIDNLKILIVSLTIAAITLIILYLIFSRISRYRKKYIDNKGRIESIKSSVSNMMNMNLSFTGATIGDAINQINFEANPCYKLKQINKDPIKEKEEEIDKMTSKFTSIQKNNSELIQELENLREEYNELRKIVENMKK